MYTDKNRLKQILNNLINNSLKYMEEGEIHCGYFQEDNCLKFYVKNTRVGIPIEKQDLVFERFGQSVAMPQKGGAGLGLAISKGLVELLGGKIWFESHPEGGTAFYFSHPLIEKIFFYGFC